MITTRRRAVRLVFMCVWTALTFGGMIAPFVMAMAGMPALACIAIGAPLEVAAALSLSYWVEQIGKPRWDL